ncbi:hypothetical protein ACFQ0B_04130 [Nonomuraea thailandensis]
MAIGDLPELPVTGLPPKPGTAVRGTRSTGSRATGLSLEPRTGALSLRPGEHASLTLRLTNTTSDEIRGESQLASPGARGRCSPRSSRASRSRREKRST